MNEHLLIETVIASWKLVIHRVDQRLATLTEEQLQQQIAPGRNRLFYLLGHLTAFHDQTLPLLGLGEPLHPNLVSAYISNPDGTLPDPLSATNLKKAWHEVNAALTSGVEKFTESDWVQPHTAVSLEDFLKTPTRNRLAVFLNRTNHVSFHAGQAVLAK